MRCPGRQRPGRACAARPSLDALNELTPNPQELCIPLTPQLHSKSEFCMICLPIIWLKCQFHKSRNLALLCYHPNAESSPHALLHQRGGGGGGKAISGVRNMVGWVEEISVGRPWRTKKRRPHAPSCPNSHPHILERSLGIVTGLWIVYSLLTTLFAHLVGPEPVA